MGHNYEFVSEKDALKMAKFYYPDRHKEFEGKMWRKYNDILMDYRKARMKNLHKRR